jgi:hypothetical protein
METDKFEIDQKYIIENIIKNILNRYLFEKIDETIINRIREDLRIELNIKPHDIQISQNFDVIKIFNLFDRKKDIVEVKI